MTSGKTLVGTHTYDLLANPHYLDDFQYIACNVPNREKYIIDSDSDEGNDDAQCNLTRVALNLGYLNEKEAKVLKFEKEAFIKVHHNYVGRVVQGITSDFFKDV